MMLYIFKNMLIYIILFYRSQHKRKGKDTKYGFGGKKRGMKGNTTESTFGGSGKSNMKGKNKGRIAKKKRMSSKH